MLLVGHSVLPRCGSTAPASTAWLLLSRHHDEEIIDLLDALRVLLNPKLLILSVAHVLHHHLLSKLSHLILRLLWRSELVLRQPRPHEGLIGHLRRMQRLWETVLDVLACHLHSMKLLWRAHHHVGKGLRLMWSHRIALMVKTLVKKSCKGILCVLISQVDLILKERIRMRQIEAWWDHGSPLGDADGLQALMVAPFGRR